MNKFSSIAMSVCVVSSLIVPTASQAASFSISEPFNTVGPLSSAWITSGTIPPSVVQDQSQTPSKVLQLTNNDYDQNGFALYNRVIPIDQGVDITFKQAQWGGNGAADGISFFIKNASDTTNTPGASGGGLGYAPDVWTPGSVGISGALLGVGLDGYGNFDEIREDGNDCNHSQFTQYPWPDYSNTIVLRGPGTGQTGYCRLADTQRLSELGLENLVGIDRASSARTVRVSIDPATDPNPRVKVWYQGTQVFDIAEPTEFASVSGIKLGFAASTGGETDHHDIWGLTVATPGYTAPTPTNLANTGSEGLANETYAAVAMLVAGFSLIFLQRRRVKKNDQ
jgi:hypothetical protein